MKAAAFLLALLFSFQAQAQEIDALGGTVAPSGSAGGCLAGSYPNPSVASGCTITSPALAGTATGNNTVPLAILQQGATNTIVGNAMSGTANYTALAIGGCSTSSSGLIWTTNTGWGCNTAINAATLGAATFAAPGAIGGTTPSTGAFTTVTASTSLSSPTVTTGSGDLTVGATTGNVRIGTGSTPTIASGACGTGTNGTLAAGSRANAGTVQIGASAATSCTVVFATAMTTAPVCVFAPADSAGVGATVLAYISANTVNGFVISGTALANVNFNYICL